MRLQRLTGLERERSREYEEIMELIAKLKEILEKEELRMGIIKLSDIKERYGDERRSEMVYAADDLTSEDMIPNEEMLLTISPRLYQTYKSE